MKQRQKSSDKNSRGAAMLEVAILIALLICIAIPSLRSVGQASSDQFDHASKAIAGSDIVTSGGCDPSNPDFPNC
jgi:Flp pilus assembly pilin Flp